MFGVSAIAALVWLNYMYPPPSSQAQQLHQVTWIYYTQDSNVAAVLCCAVLCCAVLYNALIY